MNIESMISDGKVPRVIHKFPAKSGGVIKLGLPAKFLRADLHYGAPQMWVEHSPKSSVQVEAHIAIYGIGCTIQDPEEQYLGTFFDGPYVLHIYARMKKSS